MMITVRCETPGCGNAGHDLELDVPDDVEVVLCGVCGTPLPFPRADG